MRSLQGVRVFDLTLHIVGPISTMLLGALGAEVIHVEAPGSPHGGAADVPPFMNGTPTNYIQLMMNKRSLAMDLKQADQLELRVRSLPRATCSL